MPRPILLTAILLAGCLGESGRADRLSTGWPDWQRIESGEPPAAWRVEEASPALDAWEATATVAAISTADGATTLRFEGDDGAVWDVRLAAVPDGRIAPDVATGNAVRVSMVERVGFEGTARGLTLRDGTGRLLLLYDDGGYGPAIPEDGAREGIRIARDLSGPGSGDRWRSRDVTFSLGETSTTCSEGETCRLGRTDWAATVVVSAEWTGDPPTDVDLTPLAYLIFRVR